MKVFNRSKYTFLGVYSICVNDTEEDYYAFQCIKEGFEPEVVMIKEAILRYDNWGKVSFTKKELNDPSRVKGGTDFEKSLVVNERKWRDSREPLKTSVVTH